MELTDMDVLETMILAFSELSEKNKEKILKTTKFLLQTQNSIVPEILAAPSPLLDNLLGIQSSFVFLKDNNK